MFCPNCAHKNSDQAISCPSCGHPLNGGHQKSRLVTGLLWWFFGFLGAHRFYLGDRKLALAMAGSFIISAWVMGLQFLGEVSRPADSTIALATLVLICTICWIVIDGIILLFRSNEFYRKKTAASR